MSGTMIWGSSTQRILMAIPRETGNSRPTFRRRVAGSFCGGFQLGSGRQSMLTFSPRFGLTACDARNHPPLHSLFPRKARKTDTA
ncbi:hypothetical protein NPIL_433741 [Nephila pilipes]|uniref:Uncharacterized protein n=1 Tax=Nephila pilipes TaxID=299642 RepID=A0A8X6ICZ5_NEPPI|nr:hypothetical protein NPIL_433741 [Nephila pilipes]